MFKDTHSNLCMTMKIPLEEEIQIAVVKSKFLLQELDDK